MKVAHRIEDGPLLFSIAGKEFQFVKTPFTKRDELAIDLRDENWFYMRLQKKKDKFFMMAHSGVGDRSAFHLVEPLHRPLIVEANNLSVLNTTRDTLELMRILGHSDLEVLE